jgi:hypothetical protein
MQAVTYLGDKLEIWERLSQHEFPRGHQHSALTLHMCRRIITHSSMLKAIAFRQPANQLPMASSLPGFPAGTRHPQQQAAL